MKFYKVKQKCDNMYFWKDELTIIGGELFTEKFIDKLKQKDKIKSCCDEIEISKNKTYCSFGCRFLMDD